MKKFFSILLALAMVLSIGAAAFAIIIEENIPATSPAVDDPNPEGKDLAYRGPALNQSKKPDEKKTVKLTVNGVEVPIQLIDITNADTLPAEEKAAFLKAFEEVRKITDKVVKYFFWLMPAGAGTPGEFEFSCEGTGVEVTVNGNQMAVVSEGGENYIATLTEYGALAIMCDA